MHRLCKMLSAVRWRRTLAVVVVLLGSGAMQASTQAQGPRLETGVGFAAGGPSRVGAEFVVADIGYRVATFGRVALTLNASGMLKVGAGPRVVCLDGGILGNALCDTRELRDVAKVGVSARYALARNAAPYVSGFAGVWGSTWDTRQHPAGLVSTPYGAVFDLGGGAPLPIGDRRTAVELRYGVFRQAEAGIGVPAVVGDAVRIMLTRSW
jgi:hypothetical protein